MVSEEPPNLTPENHGQWDRSFRGEKKEGKERGGSRGGEGVFDDCEGSEVLKHDEGRGCILLYPRPTLRRGRRRGTLG